MPPRASLPPRKHRALPTIWQPVRQHLVTPASASSLRSVNNRFLDLGFRLPDEFRSLEPALRDLLSAAFRRGKIELRLNTRTDSETQWPQPQPDQLNRLVRLESTVQGWMPKAQGLSVHEIMQWCKGASVTEKLDEVALDAAKRCIAELREARGREGKKLVAVLMERVDRLRALALQAEPLVPAVVKRQQQRFIERWTEALEATGAAQTISREALQERALNEAAAYSIRIDVAEELARLRSHLDEDRAPAEGRRRDRQAARLPDPGIAARSQHARLEGFRAGTHQHLGRDEGRDRAAARAGPEHRVTEPDTATETETETTMDYPGNLYVVAAPSGAGKSSLVSALLQVDSHLVVAVSHTTRAPRGQEQQGREYQFTDAETFRAMIARGDFLEWAEVHGNLYGTSRQAIESLITSGRDVVLEIDWQGALQIKKLFPNANLIFILPPSWDELLQRLHRRGEDQPDVIATRMANARIEVSQARHFDFVIINALFETALFDLKAIVHAQRLKYAALQNSKPAVFAALSLS